MDGLRRASPRRAGLLRWGWGLLLLGVLLAVGGTTWLASRWRTAQRALSPQAETPSRVLPVDPRLSYTGPFRNIHPGVRYVGDAACVDCHADIARKYRDHSMARSVQPIAAVAPRQSYEKDRNNPFIVFGSSLEVRREGERVWHRVRRLDADGRLLYELEHEVHFAIGSGSHGYSYLTARDGCLFQTPISWFSSRGIWDKSPRFREEQLAGRPIDAECLFCHTSQARYREGSANRFDAPIFEGFGIGCERCHGPGELHVARRSGAEPVNGIDDSIVNPRHLPHGLREAVCQQCHLKGDVRILRRGTTFGTFRPGLALEAQFSVFVRAAEAGVDRKAVNHVEQMYTSTCFRRGSGEQRLSCTSCHDPHERIAGPERVSYYRDRCLRCHEQQGCRLPEAQRQPRGNSCIDCHMPRYGTSDIAHTASTDHRILRDPTRPAATAAAADGPGGPALWPGVPIVPFDRASARPSDPELLRDLGMALVEMGADRKIEPHVYGDRALALLDSALQRDPEDVPAALARARGLLLTGRPRAALPGLEQILSIAPQREDAVVLAAIISQSLQESEKALEYWRRAVKLNPTIAQYRTNLAAFLAATGEWREARSECERSLQIDPASTTCRRTLITCLVRTGEIARARQEMATLEVLQPEELPYLRRWFAELLP
jgi:hypothetical protein